MKHLHLLLIAFVLFSCSKDPLKLEAEKITDPCDFYEAFISINQARTKICEKGLALIKEGEDTNSVEIKAIVSQNYLLNVKYDEIKKVFKSKTRSKIDKLASALAVKEDCPDNVALAPETNDQAQAAESSFISALNFNDYLEFVYWAERNALLE
jgi:hypothetical protein